MNVKIDSSCYRIFSRICTAVLAVTLLLQSQTGSSMLKYKQLLLGIAVLLPFVLVAVLTIIVTIETEPHGDKRDPNFQYGETQV